MFKKLILKSMSVLKTSKNLLFWWILVSNYIRFSFTKQLYKKLSKNNTLQVIVCKHKIFKNTSLRISKRMFFFSYYIQTN